MQKKLNLMTTPAPALYMDIMKVQYTIPQGSQVYTGFGGIATQNYATPYNFTSSPEDVNLMLVGPINLNGSSGNLGQERTIINNWRTEYFFSNIDNSPVEIECIGIKCKKDLPYIRDWLEAKSAATGAGALTIPTVQLTFEAWLSHQARVSQNNIGGIALADLSTLNPNQTAVPDNKNFTNVPGARLTDIAAFNSWFKIFSRKTRILQPGEAYKFVKFSKRPKFYTESTMVDFADFTTGGGTQWGQLIAAKKGCKLYIFRLCSVPVAQHLGGTASVTMGKGVLNMIQTMRWKSSFLSSDTYSYSMPALLPTNTVEFSIFPGTSTAAPQAPAT